MALMAKLVATCSPLDHRSLAEALLPAVVAAARIALKHAEAGITAEAKVDESPVTAADRDGQEVIVAALRNLAPDIPVIAEEWSGARPLSPASERFFLVDPLDGTRDYIAGFPDYTVNVALIEHGQPVFGMIMAPALRLVFATLAPHAAGRLQLPSDLALPPAGTALPWQQISARAPIAGHVVALVSRSHPCAATEAYLQRIAASEVRRVGSAYKLCLLASGAADVYPRCGPTSEWDIAAGHALLVAAGGNLETFDGAPFTYGKAAAGFRNPPFVAWGAGQPSTS